jgi:phosphomannomutase
MQIGVLALGLAARLHREQGSFAGYYLDLLEQHGIRWRFYERRDVSLFDESLQGEARAAAQSAANRRKEAIVALVASLEGRAPAEITAELRGRLPVDLDLPAIERCYHAGDGTLIELDDHWFELRASGTDAVLRYYLEGRDRDRVSALNDAFTRLRVDVD